VTVMKGTQSADLELSLAIGCQYDLTFTPNPSAVGIEVTPIPLKIAKGVRKISLRVSVSKEVAPGSYKVRWTTSGDGTPASYAPLKYLTVIVVDDSPVVVELQPVPSLSIGSTSVPIDVSTINAPDKGFTIGMTPRNA
jgi:hypothetical protein